MTEPKFTPANWITEKAKHNGFVIYELGVGKKTIARMPECSFSIYGNLIAVAPELYAELEKCAKLLRSYEHHHLQKGDREKADRNRRRAENCERVLAKARGE